MNIILPIKDIFIIAGNIVFSVLYNEHLEFPCRCQLLSSNRLIQYVERDNTHLLTMNFVIFILEIMLHYMRYIMR